MTQKLTRTHKALVFFTLPYAAETWTVRTKDAGILESCLMKCQRQILGINVDVTNQSGLPLYQVYCNLPSFHHSFDGNLLLIAKETSCQLQCSID